MNDALAAWVGRAETRRERLDARQVRLMRTILPRADDADDETVPPLWHWLFFPTDASLDALGRDGHPARGQGIAPPIAPPRRMWAGGRVWFQRPTPVDREAERRSRILSIESKAGRSGELCFLTVEHVLVVGNEDALREEHDIVYRADPAPGDAPAPPSPPPAAQTGDVRATLTPTTTMLFRYSALTFNGHRVHYDRDYARAVEGYPDVVVHGPLIATLLADLATRDRSTPLTRFAYRAVAPCFVDRPLTLHARADGGETRAWAVRDDGGLAMTATAAFA